MSEHPGGGHDWWTRFANLSDSDRSFLQHKAHRVRFAFAFVLIVGGVLLFLTNLGLFPAFNLWNFWPVFPMVGGLSVLGNARNAGARVWGMFLILFGALFLLMNFGLIHLHGDGSWPVALVLIAVGAVSLFSVLESSAKGHIPPPHRSYQQRSPQEEFVHGARSPQPDPPRERWHNPHRGSPPRRDFPPRHDAPHASPHEWWKASMHHQHTQRWFHDRISDYVVLGALKRKVESHNFQGGEMVTVFGNLEADLRSAVIPAPGGMAVLHVTALFGAAKLRVPREWRVHIHGTSVFANFEDKTIPPNTGPNAPTLVITGWSLFSSIEIED